ncbi:MAG TPA: DNA-directed RNA polymerase subunit alpha C-terminal domain-containing protein [Gemmataceae bacterium]|nr:DNA-directed RNA polymerase subunit alpha C-terminal domain-containing protein [Gemmataceae bacterium]
MVEPMLIDLKAILVEREDCDAGTVQKIREALAQGKTQYRTLRDVTDVLKKKAEAAAPPQAKRWHLKLGIASFFLGHLADAVKHLQQAEGALANFYLGRALVEKNDYDEALKAFEKAEKSGYTASQVQLQRAGIHRQKGDIAQARTLLGKMTDQATHNAEYHFQLASCFLTEGERPSAVRHLEKSVELDPSHTGALFQLGHANDLAGNDEEAITYYERCVSHPPVHAGVLMNLGILYEDHDKYDKAAECYRKVSHADPANDHARLFLRDAQASVTMYYNPDDDVANSRFSQVLEIPVTDFELSVRSRNCLKKMNIRTLGDLTRVSEQSLLSSKNFGETSLMEIKEMLTSKGLHLGQSLEEGSVFERRFTATAQLSDEEQAMLAKPVAELNLSVRARKCMNRLGINTFGELISRSADELLESKNFGQTSLTEVREKLRTFGLGLRGD